jgi:DNA-binding SARP family transcriptional activator/tetratricopeptide (TPR) repeat protein
VSRVEIRLLGPLEAVRDGAIVALGGTKQRAVLALLALNSGQVVSSDRLVSALWGDEPPSTAATAVQGHVSRLRRLLGAEAIVTRPPGYVLNAATDVSLFERLLEEGDHRGALALWRGGPLSDLDTGLDVTDGIHRLDELRLSAQEELFDAELRAGRHSDLIPALEAYVRAQPLRERPVEQLMLALYRAGRQADALAAYGRLRERLRDELGLEPGERLRALQRRILEQDPALAPPGEAELAGARGTRTPVSVVAVGIEAAPDEPGEPDPEAYENVVSRAREAVRLALERHGGSVQRTAGAGLLGLFGVPSPREDDAERALRAAAQAIEAVERVAGELKRYGLGLSARAGVASGEAFGGQTPAVERALRLQAEAEDGLLVDDATRARADRRELRLDRPLAGRGREQRTLREAYERVLHEGRSSLVTIAGPAGIGKSRLAADLLQSVKSGTRFLYVRCLSYGDGVSLLPAIDLVHAAAGISPEATRDQAQERLSALIGDDPGTVEQLLRLIGLGDEPGGEDETVWALRRLLERAARRSPVVVLVDDLHWASPPTLDLLERLVEPVPAPLLVTATTRETPREALRPTVLELGPIDASACAEVTAGLLGGAGTVAPDTLSALVEHSGGNPLFLEEVVRALRAEGRLQETDGRWHLDRAELPAPRSIESLLASRLGRLPEREREVLLAASVIGRSFTPDAVEELVGDSIDDEIASLLAAALIGPSRSEGLDFRHLLIRDAAYTSLPLERRAELHRRHADWVVRSSIAAPLEREALAFYHLDQSLRSLEALAPGDARVAAEAGPLGSRAAALGRALLNRGDAASAAAVLSRALDLGLADPNLPVDLGRAHFDVGDFAAAEQAFALATAGAAADRARLGMLEVAMRTDSSVDLAAARAEIDRIRSALERTEDANGLAEAWLASAYLAVVRGNAGELVEQLEQALAYARRSGRPRVESWILFLVCGACWYGPMHISDGIRRCEQVRSDALGRPNVEAAALQSLAVLRAMNGETAEARRFVSASRSIRRDLGQEIGAAASAIDEGLVELLAGDDARAERVLRGGYADLRRIGEKGYFSTVACLLGEAVIGQGRVDEARALAREAAEAAAEDDVASQVGWRAVEARGLAAEGNHDEAEALARQAVDLAGQTDFLFLLSEGLAALADVLVARGDASGAAESRTAARALMEQKGCARSAVDAWTGGR